MPLDINFIIILTSTIFSIGLIGVILNRKNILMILISIEMLILAININFATLSLYLDDIIGHIFILFILTIAAAESAIGLILITTLFQLKNSIELETVKQKLINKI
jgi:NADH-quinone oxidoreductase subunit K